MANSDQTGAETSTRSAILKAVGLLVFLGGAAVAYRYSPLSHALDREALAAFFTGIKNSPWGPLIFMGLYAAACAVAIPGTLFTLLGGVLFGAGAGTIYNLTAACAGASLAFGLARTLGRDFVSLFLKGEKMAGFDRKVADNGFQVILTLRLVPLFPFTGINFGAGLSKVSYRNFLAASAIGMLPGTFIYTYFADSLYRGVAGAGSTAILNLVIAGTLLILLSFVPVLYKKYKTRFTNPRQAAGNSEFNIP